MWTFTAIIEHFVCYVACLKKLHDPINEQRLENGVLFVFVKNLTEKTNVHDFNCLHSHKMHDFKGDFFISRQMLTDWHKTVPILFQKLHRPYILQHGNITHGKGQLQYWLFPQIPS